MTAPTLVGTPSVATSTSATAINAALPTGPFAVGDQLFILIATADRTVTADDPDWTLVTDYRDTGFSRTSLFSKVSDGTEGGGGSEAFTASALTPFVAIGWAATGGDLGLVVASAGRDGATATIGGDELDTGADAVDGLWMWCAGWVDDDGNLTAYPDLYTLGRTTGISGGGTNAGAGAGFAARRALLAADTPDDATIDQAEAWATFTVLLPPTRPAPMAAPTKRAGLEVDVKPGDRWEAVGETGVFHRDPVEIRHGRSGWASRAEHSALRFTADNRSGAWSEFYAGNANGPRLKRNAEVRAGAVQPDAFLEPVARATGETTGASTPDTVDLSVTGDIDLRAEVEIVRTHGDASETQQARVIRKDGAYTLRVGYVAGVPRLRLFWEDSGGTHDYSHVIPWELTARRAAFRFTLDVSTGEGISYYSDAIDGTWVELSTSTSAGATNIEDSAEPLELCSGPVSENYDNSLVRLYRAEVRDGIDGTLVADVDLTGVTPGAATFDDDTGNTWTIGQDARVTRTRPRFHGELVDAAARWALSGNDQWAPIEAAGLQRRLRQGNDSPLQSALRRGYDRSVYASDILAYWPMEEDGDASISQFGAVVGDRPLVHTAGDAQPAAFDGFACSRPIPTMGDASYQASLPPSSTTEWMARCLFHAPTDLTADITFMEVLAGQDVWHLTYLGSSGGDLGILAYDVNGNTFESRTINFNIAGLPVRYSFTVEQNGADIDWGIGVEDISGFVGGFGDTISTHTYYPPTLVRLCKDLDGDSLAIGHLSFESTVRAGDLGDELTAYAGETAARRVIRLCREEGLAHRIVGDPDDSIPMGPQRPLRLVELLDECADTDLGILFDPAEVLAVGYRTGASIRAQDPRLTLDYDGAQVDGVPRVDRDDRDFRNDVTVTNWDGADARAELTTGEQSTAQPPAGVGRLDAGYTINTSGTDLDGHAYTRLLLHTPATPRLSQLVLTFELAGVTDALRRAFLELLPGDLIRLADLPSTVHTDDLWQIVQGWTERITSPVRSLALNTTAGDPWRIGRADDDALYDTGGSVLATAVDAAATSLVVGTTIGPLWTTDGAHFPLDIEVDGVRLTVSAISGSTSPQTFTVGATPRYIPGGAAVSLADPAYYTF